MVTEEGSSKIQLIITRKGKEGALMLMFILILAGLACVGVGVGIDLFQRLFLSLIN